MFESFFYVLGQGIDKKKLTRKDRRERERRKEREKKNGWEQGKEG